MNSGAPEGVNNIERTCCVAGLCAKFSSGTNPVPYLEEEEEG
jgi:hypothetical protein